MTKTIQNISIIALVSIFIMAISIFVGVNVNFAGAAAPSGLPAQVSTSSSMQAGPQQATVWFSGPQTFTNVNCAARIITTGAQAVALTFSGTSSSTATSTLTGILAAGHVQAASTTEVYDGGIYGCQYLGIRGYGATTTIFITETR